jgi:hypothetical protein
LDFLKTIPDMTNPPEITMHEKTPKISMAQRIRNYKAANPDAPVKEIAEAVGTTAVYVYQIFAAKQKKEKIPKKRNDMLIAPKQKTEGFAIGVSQPHYWVISALASGKKTNRSAVLREIIDQYIRDVLTEAKSDGASV